MGVFQWCSDPLEALTRHLGLRTEELDEAATRKGYTMNATYQTLEDVELTIDIARRDIARMRLRQHRVSAWKAANLTAWIDFAEASLARDIGYWQAQGWGVR